MNKSNRGKIILALIAWVLSMSPVAITFFSLYNQGCEWSEIDKILMPDYIYLILIFIVNIVFYQLNLKESNYAWLEKIKLLIFILSFIIVVGLLLGYYEIKFSEGGVVENIFKETNLKIICLVLFGVGILAIIARYRQRKT
ncbi:MAG: hypothetical protein Mars2KO_44250 [Maribacter sp.]